MRRATGCEQVDDLPISATLARLIAERSPPAVHRLTGNFVEIIEYSAADVSARLDEGSELLRQISTEGRLILGSDLEPYQRSWGA